jgi:ketosteroid isomerase-like protein
MSQENVDHAHAFFDAVNRRDLDAMLAETDEQIKYVSILVAMEGGYDGHAGIRRWWADVFDAIPDYTIEVEAIHDLDDATLAHFTLRGHGRASNAPIEQRLAHIMVWRDGKAVYAESFATEAEALSALGR